MSRNDMVTIIFQNIFTKLSKKYNKFFVPSELCYLTDLKVTFTKVCIHASETSESSVFYNLLCRLCKFFH